MFTTNPIQLSKLLNEIDDGEMQLPEFQRGWIWDDFRIRDLLTSVAQGFPIGAIMRLDAGGDMNFKPRPVEGSCHDRQPDTFLLDGQQRMTSLYQALKYPGPVDTHNSTGKKVERWYYIDMKEAMKRTPDHDKMIFSLPANRQRTSNIGRKIELDLSNAELEYEQHMFPTERLLEPTSWLLGYVNHWTGKTNPNGEPGLFFTKFNEKVIKSFQTFQLPVIDLDKGLPREAVCIVFDKVNTGGVPLTTFELLTAMLAAEGFDLRDDWQKRQQSIHDHSRVLRAVGKDQFIRVVALMVTTDRRQQSREAGASQVPAVGCRRSDILSINRTEYEKWAGKAEEGFKRAAHFLTKQSIFSARDIPYVTQVTSLAFLYATMSDEIETQNSQLKLERWFWSGIFGEVYGGTTESIMANDAQFVPGYLRGKGSFQLLDEVTFEPARLLSLRTRNTAAYKGINALLMKRGAVDWMQGSSISITSYFDENIDIHHIFPRRWCERESAKFLGEPIPARIFNCAINKTPLSSKTNRIIGGRSPSEYMQRLRSHNSELEVAIEGHNIDVDYLKRDDFDDFFIRRGRSLMILISDAMGKKLDDGEEIFRNALEAANLRIETDEYDDEEEVEFIPIAAG